MDSTTQDQLDRIVRAVFDSPAGECCQDCIIKEIHRQARRQHLRVSGWNVKARVKALWTPAEPPVVVTPPPLTREELDAERCSTPGCECGGELFCDRFAILTTACRSVIRAAS